MEVRNRVHPVTVFETIYKQLFLLLIPLVRGLFSIYSADGFYEWLSGAWVDILVVVFMLVFSLLNWRCQSYVFCDGGMVVYKGILLRRTTYVPAASISTLMCYEPFYLRPLRAVHIYADTDAGSIRRADFQITIGRKAAQQVLQAQFPEKPQAGRRMYRPKWFDIAFLSVFVSSTITGVLFISTFFSRAGDIFGESFLSQLMTQVEGIAELLFFIPRAAVIVAILILSAWLVGFIHSFMSYIRFSAIREKDTLRLQYGWLTKRGYTCRVEAINFLDFRQSIISRMLNIYMVFIQCAGYAKTSGEHAVLIPAADAQAVKRYLRFLLPEFHRRQRQIHPPRGSIIRYAMIPFWCSLLIPAAAVLAAWLFPFWKRMIVFFGIMATLPFIWLLLVRIIDCNTAGIGVTKRHVTLRYTVGYAFHTVVIPREKINHITIRSSWIQKLSGNCDVMIYTYHELSHRHKVENLRISDVQALLEKYNLLSVTDDEGVV